MKQHNMSCPMCNGTGECSKYFEDIRIAQLNAKPERTESGKLVFPLDLDNVVFGGSEFNKYYYNGGQDER